MLSRELLPPAPYNRRAVCTPTQIFSTQKLLRQVSHTCDAAQVYDPAAEAGVDGSRLGSAGNAVVPGALRTRSSTATGQLERDGVLSDNINVWTDGFASWCTLGETRWQFGLAEVMLADMPIDSGDAGADDGASVIAIPQSKRREHADGEQSQAKPHREKKEKAMDVTKTAAIKLSSLCVHAGFLCTTELKETSGGESKEPVEDAGGGEDNSDELREVFSEFDSDGSGQLDRDEIAEAMQKALGSVGKKVTEAELDKMIGEMDEDGSGEIGFDEFAQWWASQASSSSTDSKMSK
eukprot:COSAG03_NODE_1766_length_3551_cov_9.381228_3_plen_294_part_00